MYGFQNLKPVHSFQWTHLARCCDHLLFISQWKSKTSIIKLGPQKSVTLPWEAKHHKEGSFMSRVYSLLLTARVTGLRWVFRVASWLAESYRTWFDLLEVGLAIKNHTPASVSHGHLCHQHLFRNPLGYLPWTGNKHWRLRPNIQAFQFSFWFNTFWKTKQLMSILKILT